MDSVSQENVEKIMNDYEKKKKELEIVQSTTIQQMWLNELSELKEAYSQYRELRERLMVTEQETETLKQNVTNGMKVKKVKKKVVLK